MFRIEFVRPCLVVMDKIMMFVAETDDVGNCIAAVTVLGVMMMILIDGFLTK